MHGRHHSGLTVEVFLRDNVGRHDFHLFKNAGLGKVGWNIGPARTSNEAWFQMAGATANHSEPTVADCVAVVDVFAQ